MHKLNALDSLDLADPRVSQHYMVAMHILHEPPPFGWYDSCFLAKFEAARRMLAILEPDRVQDFAAAFDVLRTRSDFQVQVLSHLLSRERFVELLSDIRALPPALLKTDEEGVFGRKILRDIPVLAALQSEMAALVSTLAGEPVEPSYSFLSLYAKDGCCPPHLDAPSAKWTLDLCLEQSEGWPIHFSDVVPWPEASKGGDRPVDLTFQPHTLQPNGAVLFSGSSQWHYRNAIPPGGHCNLAFLHYHPAGCADLVRPARWPAYFGIPALAVLDTVYDTLFPVPGS